MEVTLGIQGGDTIPIFHGYIDDVSNLNHEDLTCQIVAYDALYNLSNLDVLSWYNSLNFPMTVKTFRNSLFNYIGIQQVSTILPNDSRTLTKTYSESSLMAIDVMKALCQINARVGRINRDNKFEYMKIKPLTEGLYPSDDLFPDDDLYPSEENAYIILNKSDYINIEYQNYKTEKVTGVKIYKEDGSLANSYGNFKEQFTIHDNFLVDGITSYTDFARSIYNEIFQVQFIPANIKLTACPYMEIGDGVMINTRKNLVRTYIMTRKLTGIQAAREKWECQSEQYQPEYKESVKSSVYATKTQIANTNTALTTTATNLNNRINTTNTNLQTTNNNLRITNTNLSNNVSRLDSRIDTTNSNVNSVSNSLSSNVSRLDGRINSTNNSLSSLSGTVSTHTTQIGNLSSNISSVSSSLNSLSSIAITKNNWHSQTVTDGMISGMNASKLTGTISPNRLPRNLGEKEFSTLQAANLYLSRLNGGIVVWSTLEIPGVGKRRVLCAE